MRIAWGTIRLMIKYYHSTARSRTLELIEEPKAGAWIHVVEPLEAELDRLAEMQKLDRDILNDALDVYEAPRVEVSDGTTYVFTRFCYPSGQDISTQPLLIIYTADHIITVMRQAHSVLDRMVEGHVEVLTTQKTKTFLQILVEINHSYRTQLTLVSKQILRSRGQLRKAQIKSADIVRYIELEEDLNEFLTALQPQALVLNALESGKYMKLYEDDRDLVDDLMLSTSELIEFSKSRMKTVINMRQAYDAIATTNLNKTFRRLTSIAIFLTIPTIVGGLFGMNVALPFEDNPSAFLFVLAIIAGLMVTVIGLFKKLKWI